MTEKVTEKFMEYFGGEPQVVASAPGRVNLIGEHTDYNDGMVLPMAINRRIWVAGRTVDDDAIRMSSDNQPEKIEIKGDLPKQNNWADYPLGVIWALREHGHSIDGMELFFCGDVPLGGGLSSSAAIEVATATLIVKMNGLSIDRTEIAKICQQAENSFVGMNCGIMDQMASALCRKNHALFLDCRDLSYENVPLELGEYRIVIINSGVSRELVDSGYNQRRSECEQGAETLGVDSLRDLDAEDFPGIEKLPRPINRRVRHVISENHRVMDAVKHLKSANLEEFGMLMKLSHQSLRDDYEVSTPGLDYLVDNALEIEGVIGARLTGAGFGGSIIALAHENAIDKLKQNLLPAYRDKFNKEPDLIVTTPDDGARIETWR